MIDYAAVRQIHITSAAFSIGLFAARGGMQCAGIDWRRWRWLRIVPHVNDTVLLGAAVVLAVMSAQYPWREAWLAAKLLGLCVYVALGRAALRPANSPTVRRLAFSGALVTVAYIVGVAVSRSATWGWG